MLAATLRARKDPYSRHACTQRLAISTNTARGRQLWAGQLYERAAATVSRSPAGSHVGVAAAGCTADGCGLGGAVLHGACRHCCGLCPKHCVAARGVLCLLEGGCLRAEAAPATRVRVSADRHARGLTSRYNAGAGLCPRADDDQGHQLQVRHLLGQQVLHVLSRAPAPAHAHVPCPRWVCGGSVPR